MSGTYYTGVGIAIVRFFFFIYYMGNEHEYGGLEAYLCFFPFLHRIHAGSTT
jgi:hypothetical protein